MAGLDNFWAKVSEEVRRQAEEKHSSEVKMPTIKQLGMRGACYNVIREAVQGEKASKMRSERFGRAYAVIYLLLTEALDLCEEVEMGVDREFLQKHSIKVPIKKMQIGFEECYNILRPIMSAKEMKQYNIQLSVFDENVRSWARLEGYKTIPTNEQIKENAEKRLLNLHLDFLDKLTEYQELFGEDEAYRFAQTLKSDQIDALLKQRYQGEV